MSRYETHLLLYQAIPGRQPPRANGEHTLSHLVTCASGPAIPGFLYLPLPNPEQCFLVGNLYQYKRLERRGLSNSPIFRLFPFATIKPMSIKPMSITVGGLRHS